MMSVPAKRFAMLRDAIHAQSFAPAAVTRRVGAEVELLALDAATGFPVPLVSGRRSLVHLLRRYAVAQGWQELVGYGAVPRFDIPGQGIISFEPGGQLELSANPCDSVTELVSRLRGIVALLRAALRDEGVQLDSIGIDPLNDARDIPLQLLVDRYETMTRYFDQRGPFGIRMMRQTAAIQVSLDRGSKPAGRWRLLNDLAPYITAIFANSPHYLAEDTGHRSYRAHCWRMLDPTRTGMALRDDDPAAAYTRFALAANAMWPGRDSDATDPDAAAWQTHLTTLFPEVRPRGHFEVRSCDAIDCDFYAAPIVFLTGLTYDDRSAREASILADDSRALLRAAGEVGLHDPSIARTSRDLFQLALDGARRLGDAYCGAAELETAADFFAIYTALDRSPADDRSLPARAIQRASAIAPSR